MASTTDIKHSLEAVAGNLASIQRLAAEARHLYEQPNCLSSPRAPKLPIQNTFFRTNGEFRSPQKVKLIAKKTSSSSLESGGKAISRLTTNEEITSRADSTHDLPTLLDLITSRYNEQIGVLVNSIDHLTKRLASVKQENQLLKRKVSPKQRPSSAKKKSKQQPSQSLGLPILPGFSLAGQQPAPLQARRQKNSSLVIFKPAPKNQDQLRKVRAAPIIHSHYDRFKKKLNQLNGNALTEYL